MDFYPIYLYRGALFCFCLHYFLKFNNLNPGTAEIGDTCLDIDHGQAAEMVVKPGNHIGVEACPAPRIRDQRISGYYRITAEKDGFAVFHL